MAIVLKIVTVPGGPMTRILGWRPLVYTGRISYSLYLWHTTVYFTLPFGRLHSAPWLIVHLLAAYLVAAASYHFVERPFLRRKRRLAGVPERDVPPVDEREMAAGTDG